MTKVHYLTGHDLGQSRRMGWLTSLGTTRQMPHGRAEFQQGNKTRLKGAGSDGTRQKVY